MTYTSKRAGFTIDLNSLSIKQTGNKTHVDFCSAVKQSRTCNIIYTSDNSLCSNTSHYRIPWSMSSQFDFKLRVQHIFINSIYHIKLSMLVSGLSDQANPFCQCTDVSHKHNCSKVIVTLSVSRLS